MANPESKKLHIDVIARVGQLEKQMAKAKGVTNKNFGQMEARGKQFQSRMAGIGKAAFSGFVAGFAATGVAGIVGQFQAIARGVAQIGDEAKRSGLGIRQFQELKYVAEQNRVGVDSLVDGIKELNLRADEFITTGGGSAAEAFERLGYGGQELANKLRDPSALFTEIIGKLKQLDRAAAIRIADEVFGGTGGEKFVQLIEQGEDGIRETIKAAHQLSVVMDDDVIAKAAELDRKFQAITTSVASGLKTAIVEAAGALQNFINSFNTMWERHQQRLKGAEIAFGIGAMAGQPPVPQDGPPETRTTPKTGRLPQANAPYTPPPAKPGTGGSGRDRAAAETEREAAAVRRLIDELHHELQLVGATDLQRETANALREAGASATADQKAEIISLVAALHAEELALEKATAAAEELRDIGRDVMGGLINDLIAGKSAADMLADALSNIGNRLLNAGLDGLFGGIKIPGFANGTRHAPGGLAVVGERGPELVNLPRGAQVIPNHQLRAPTMPRLQPAGGGGGTTVPINISIDAKGADREGLMRVEQQVARLKADLPATVVDTLRRAQKSRTI